jgi:hypothetical protein
MSAREQPEPVSQERVAVNLVESVADQETKRQPFRRGGSMTIIEKLEQRTQKLTTAWAERIARREALRLARKQLSSVERRLRTVTATLELEKQVYNLKSALASVRRESAEKYREEQCKLRLTKQAAQLTGRLQMERDKEEVKRGVRPDWHDAFAEKRKTRRLQKNFRGLTAVGYNRLGDAQRWSCSICEGVITNPDSLRGKALPLVVDHHHASGVVRSLTCDRCNHTIGHGLESPSRLRAAADYLEFHALLAATLWMVQFPFYMLLGVQMPPVQPEVI